MNILAIETSCDETAAAVVENGTTILSNVIASSTEMHQKYGGIVPEVAAREQLTCIIPTIEEALSEAHTHYQYIDALAVTVGPGLIGSLLVGVETAKTIAFVTKKPIIPVNHVLAHMYANFVDSSSLIVHSKTLNHEPLTMNHEPITFPAISLVVSGGHTELYLMESINKLRWLGGTLDDAAGEAFDKTARLLGFGTGGGVAIQEAAKKFTVHSSQFAVNLPRPMLRDDSLNFSFSGLKTAILRELQNLSNHFNNIYYLSDEHSFSIPDIFRNQIAFEVQEAITDVLVAKTLRAARLYDAKSILLSGGVAANLCLRKKFLTKLSPPAGGLNPKLFLHVPPIGLCTDNAVYIASYAFFRGKPIDWHRLSAIPDFSVEEK